MPFAAKCVNDLPFSVPSAYEASRQFSPSLSYLRPSRNLVYSSLLSGLGMPEVELFKNKTLPRPRSEPETLAY